MRSVGAMARNNCVIVVATVPLAQRVFSMFHDRQAQLC